MKEQTSQDSLSTSEIYAALRELGERLERCGASLELTHAVTLASDLREAIGNDWNQPDTYAAQRVRAAILDFMKSMLPENNP